MHEHEFGWADNILCECVSDEPSICVTRLEILIHYLNGIDTLPSRLWAPCSVWVREHRYICVDCRRRRPTLRLLPLQSQSLCMLCVREFDMLVAAHFCCDALCLGWNASRRRRRRLSLFLLPTEFLRCYSLVMHLIRSFHSFDEFSHLRHNTE